MSKWGELHRCASCAYFGVDAYQSAVWGEESGWCYSALKKAQTKADRPACATYRQDLPFYAKCKPGEYVSFSTVETNCKDLDGDSRANEGGADD